MNPEIYQGIIGWLSFMTLIRSGLGALTREYAANPVTANTGLYFKSHILGTFFNVTAIHCLSECAMTKNCRAFLHGQNQSVTLCVTYSKVHNDAEQGFDCDGLKYFVLGSVCSPAENHITFMDGNICFMLQFENTYTWHVAQSACTSLGGQLAIVDSRQKWDALYNLIQSLNSNDQRDGFYIDGSDELVDGTWLTKDGSNLTWINWSSGQPNNAGSDGQNCLEMKRIFNYTVNDHPCDVTRNRGFICQKITHSQ